MGHAVQKIKKLSETPRTLHKIAKLCVIDCKNTDCKNTDLLTWVSYGLEVNVSEL